MKVGVFGAGAIGASLGIRLSSAGLDVTLIGRGSLAAVADELTLTTLGGRRLQPNASLRVTEDPEALSDVDACLVTVKSRDTDAAAQTLAPILQPEAVVVSFQNGLRNGQRLRAHLQQPVAAGMVSYNVVREGAKFVQATKGPLVAEALQGAAGQVLARCQQAFAVADEDLTLREDIADVLAGKLLLNLNNGVCAATGVTIAESIRSRPLRRCFAAAMTEGLTVLRHDGLRPRSIVGLPPAWIARLLPLPDAIVLRAAKKLAAIDPAAKSSTLVDIEAGKPTEIDELCGEIVRRAEVSGHRTPANRTILAAVREHEAAGSSPRFWAPDQLWARIGEREAQ